MTTTVFTAPTPIAAAPAARQARWSAGLARTGFVLALAAAIVSGFLWTGSEASARATATAGADLTRLLRAMAVLKASMAVCAASAVLWRLGSVASLPRFLAYAAACGAMGAGPGLIWGMDYVGTGALSLHGGLLATVLMLWRDPMVEQRLADMVRARR